jgi:alpha-tubulin suppressor-like RCC1 family protein
VHCWGYNGEGQLGDGTTTDSDIPVAVTGITSAINVTNGDGASPCAVLASGTIDCWGSNELGDLGDGTTTDSDVPVPVSAPT